MSWLVRQHARLLIKKHEGWRAKPYKDTTGHTTIGYGFNLDALSMPKEVGELWLEILIEQIEYRLAHKVPGWTRLGAVRQAVLVDMAYNLGFDGFFSFELALKAIAAGDYEQAAREMLNSRWAKQVGTRADRLAAIMRTGRSPFESTDEVPTG